MRLSSYQIHHIIQVYVDKLSNGEDKKEQFCGVNLPSRNGEHVSQADGRIIAERIINDITGRINDICNSGIETEPQSSESKKETISNDRKFSADCGGELQASELEPASGINNDKDRSIRENKNYVYNFIDKSGKKISREISLNDSDWMNRR